MQNDVAMGTNRTGIKASPLDAKALQEAATLQASPPMPSTTATDLRIEYLDEAEPIGSMPPPTSVKGVFGAMKGAITGKKLHVLLDKLGERAAYERSGTRLYDAALLKLADKTLPDGMDLIAVTEIRNDEMRHYRMLTTAIRELGGDPTTQTPCADVAAVQSMGLLQAMGEPRITLPQVLQTLLAAELIDVASWELLIELSRGFGFDDMAGQFSEALASENLHLERVRAWLSTALGESALGESDARLQS